MKHMKHGRKNNNLTPSKALVEPSRKWLNTDLQQNLSGILCKERAELLQNEREDQSFNFHHDFMTKIVQLAELPCSCLF